MDTSTQENLRYFAKKLHMLSGQLSLYLCLCGSEDSRYEDRVRSDLERITQCLTRMAHEPDGDG